MQDDDSIIDSSRVPSLRLEVLHLDVVPPTRASGFPQYRDGHTYSRIFSKFNGTRMVL